MECVLVELILTGVSSGCPRLPWMLGSLESLWRNQLDFRSQEPWWIRLANGRVVDESKLVANLGPFNLLYVPPTFSFTHLKSQTFSFADHKLWIINIHFRIYQLCNKLPPQHDVFISAPFVVHQEYYTLPSRVHVMNIISTSHDPI